MTCGQMDWVGFVVPHRSRGVSRVCVGAVESCEKSCNFREISLIRP